MNRKGKKMNPYLPGDLVALGTKAGRTDSGSPKEKGRDGVLSQHRRLAEASLIGESSWGAVLTYHPYRRGAPRFSFRGGVFFKLERLATQTKTRQNYKIISIKTSRSEISVAVRPHGLIPACEYSIFTRTQYWTCMRFSAAHCFVRVLHRWVERQWRSYDSLERNALPPHQPPPI